jgi:hypothetical protein
VAEFTNPGLLAEPTGLGPSGPFPAKRLADGVERRWLHYALLSRDGRYSLVANSAWLGPPDEDRGDVTRVTTILLLHERGQPWTSSQFNADISRPAWSAFGQPMPHYAAGRLNIGAVAGEPAVDLRIHRTSRPSTSQCAFFTGSHHLRWQSETGVRAKGPWRLNGGVAEIDAVGYHERVRGHRGLMNVKTPA